MSTPPVKNPWAKFLAPDPLHIAVLEAPATIHGVLRKVEYRDRRARDLGLFLFSVDEHTVPLFFRAAYWEAHEAAIEAIVRCHLSEAELMERANSDPDYGWCMDPYLHMLRELISLPFIVEATTQTSLHTGRTFTKYKWSRG